jgi:hypothetical protein
MNLFSRIIKLDKKYAVGLIFGLLIGMTSIYVDFFRKTNPVIKFEILSNASVLDIREDVSKLFLTFEGRDIRLSKENLRIITLKISNKGSVNILKNMYDDKAPFGFSLTTGRIVEIPKLLEASNSYLKNNLRINLDSYQSTTISPIIFESDDYFILKILVLHKENKIPNIIPIGKIAGIKDIPLMKTFLENEKLGFWAELTSGSLLIHLSRFFIYIFLLIVFTIIIILPVAATADWRQNRKRQKKILLFKSKYKKSISASGEYIFSIYKEFGADIFIKLRDELKEPDSINYALSCIKEDRKEIEASSINMLMFPDFQIRKIIRNMHEKGLSKKVGKLFKLEKNIELLMNDFVSFLNNK